MIWNTLKRLVGFSDPVPPPQQPPPPKRVGVLFPSDYSIQGGMARTAIQLCRYLLDLSPEQGGPYQVVLGANIGITSDGRSRFGDLIDHPGFVLRDLKWSLAAEIDSIRCVRPFNYRGDDYLDCDSWILFGCPTEGVVAALRPFAVFCADWVVRMVPRSVDQSPHSRNPVWKNIGYAIETCRAADIVFSTTPGTRGDDTSFAGVPRARTRLAPVFSFEDFKVKPSTPVAVPFTDYFVWTTNDTAHKNHDRAFRALERYYNIHGGKLGVVVTGVAAEYFDPVRGVTANAAYTQRFQDFIAATPHLLANLHFPGPLRIDQYKYVLANAKFLWHNVIYDNGTASCFEAAQLGVPSLSSDYPQMRFFCELFETNTRFFSAFDVEEGAVALKGMERATQAGLRAMSRDAVDDSAAVKDFLAELLRSLNAQTRVDGVVAAPGSSRGALSIRAGQILRAHLRNQVWGDAALDRLNRRYFCTFPFEEVTCLSLTVSAGTSPASLKAAIVVLRRLIREKYLGAKLIVSWPGAPAEGLAALTAFIEAEVMHLEVVTVCDATAAVDAGILLLSTLHFILADGLTEDRVEAAALEALRHGCPVLAATAVSPGTLAQTRLDWLPSEFAGLDIVETSRRVVLDNRRVLNWQRLRLGAPDRRDFAELWESQVREAQNFEVVLPPEIAAIPTLASVVDLQVSSGADHFLHGVHPLDKPTTGFTWVRGDAEFVVGKAFRSLVVEAIVQGPEERGEGDVEPTMSVSINGQAIPTFPLTLGKQTYEFDLTPLLPSLDPEINRIKVSTNYEYKAGGKNSSDDRMIAWGVVRIGFVDPPADTEPAIAPAAPRR